MDNAFTAFAYAEVREGGMTKVHLGELLSVQNAFTVSVRSSAANLRGPPTVR